MMIEPQVTLAEIHAAQERIAGRIYRTPILRSYELDEVFGARLYFKAEHLQITGSFKVRGALNAIARVVATGEAPIGVITFSAGNHAAAVSYAAQRFGLPAIVCMPRDAVAEKVAAARNYGAEVRLIDGDLPAACRAIADDTGYLLVEPFDSVDVMAGQGTLGLEILHEIPELDALIVPVGGGGLIGGISAALTSQTSDIELFAAEPREAALVKRSIDSGQAAAHSQRPRTIADGLAAPFLGGKCLKYIAPRVNAVIEVEEQEINQELGVILRTLKQSVEPSAAVGLAAARRVQDRIAGMSVGIVLTGGNVSSQLLAKTAASL